LSVAGDLGTISMELHLTETPNTSWWEKLATFHK